MWCLSSHKVLLVVRVLSLSSFVCVLSTREQSGINITLCQIVIVKLFSPSKWNSPKSRQVINGNDTIISASFIARFFTFFIKKYHSIIFLKRFSFSFLFFSLSYLFCSRWKYFRRDLASYPITKRINCAFHLFKFLEKFLMTKRKYNNFLSPSLSLTLMHFHIR